jgi:drug/metabolite transporter (DMT)-like permease
MSRKGFLLFLAASVAWGVPYFFIRIAAEEFSPSMIIFARTILGAAVLIPLAIKRDSLRPALKAWKYVLLYAALEMIGPWFLITEAERVNAALIKRNAELERKLHIANVLIALQKKAHEILGLALPEFDGGS